MFSEYNMDIVLKPNCGKKIIPKNIISEKKEKKIVKRYCASKNSIPLSAIDYGKLFISENYIYENKNGKKNIIKKFFSTSCNIDGPYWYNINEEWDTLKKLRKIENDFENNNIVFFINKTDYKKYYDDEIFDNSIDNFEQILSETDNNLSEQYPLSYSDECKTNENTVHNSVKLLEENEDNVNTIDGDEEEVLGVFYNPKKRDIM